MSGADMIFNLRLATYPYKQERVKGRRMAGTVATLQAVFW